MSDIHYLDRVVDIRIIVKTTDDKWYETVIPDEYKKDLCTNHTKLYLKPEEFKFSSNENTTD